LTKSSASPHAAVTISADDALGSTYTTQTAAPFGSTYRFETQRFGDAAVYCSDGRYGEEMDDFLHNGLGLPRYDRVAIPGGANRDNNIVRFDPVAI
jgi:hypothetical protein